MTKFLDPFLQISRDLSLVPVGETHQALTPAQQINKWARQSCFSLSLLLFPVSPLPAVDFPESAYKLELPERPAA